MTTTNIIITIIPAIIKITSITTMFEKNNNVRMVRLGLQQKKEKGSAQEWRKNI
jgi:hypothetical protein